jgi:diacylglycerol O-acyltransferase
MTAPRNRKRHGLVVGTMPEPPPAVPEPMSAVDRAWLEMDGPHNPMIVASIMEFEQVKAPQRLAREFVKRLLVERRFRQRVIRAGGRYAWIEDDAMHLGYHVQIRPVPKPGTPAQVQAAIGAELGRDLDHALPLWRIHLFVQPRGRVTLLFRAHHAIADGIALMRGLLQLADGAEAVRVPPAQTNGDKPHGPLGRLIHGLETVNEVLEGVSDFVADDLRHPGQLSRQLADARRAFLAVSRVFLLPDDNPERLRVAPRGKRAVAWTGQLSFEAVHRHARAQDVTVNDVFLTALTGAFGRWLRGADGRLDEQQNLRVSVPVNLRAPGDGNTGNGFGLVLVDLPVGLEGPHARLDVIAERMARLKQSPEARATFASLAAAGHLPVAAEKQLVNFIGGKAVAVVSNLAGPREALALGGYRLANMVFWPPQTGGIGIGVSCLSYAGHLTVGVSVDTAQVGDPRQLIDHFCTELHDMLGHSPFARPAGSRRPAHPSSTARSSAGETHVQTH